MSDLGPASAAAQLSQWSPADAQGKEEKERNSEVALSPP